MNITPEQFKKLPKYARMEIARLRGDLAHERERIVAVGDDNVVGPRLVIEPYASVPVTFDRRAAASWHQNDNWFDRVDAQWVEDERQSGLRVSVDQLIVLPQASNVVLISSGHHA